MVKFTSIFSVIILGASCTSGKGLYGKDSPVLQVDAKGYDKFIARSNHPSLVEFYAPWCGHCQKLKFAYEKVAGTLIGLAKVAAVNCDDDKNKAFCNQMSIKGFPTLKIIVPSKKPGKPVIEEYKGRRSVKDIKKAVIDRIPNHVKRVTDKSLDGWLAESNSTAKALLFSKKGTTSGIYRSLAIDFLDSIEFAQLRNKEKAAVAMFGVKDFPQLILLPGGNELPITYDGVMEKKPMLKFLSQFATPQPDGLFKGSKKTKDSKRADSEASSQSAAQKGMFDVGQAAEMPTISDNSQLQKTCLRQDSKLCILAFVGAHQDSANAEGSSISAEKTLWGVVHNHAVRGGSHISFYAVSKDLESSKGLLNKLNLEETTSTTFLAINAKRGWWSKYEPVAGSEGAYKKIDLEAWVDQIKMGEGKRDKLPASAVSGGATENRDNDDSSSNNSRPREEL
ncbi:hypothetical protein KEM54_004075 [Ascosphaera aggregata]|nr:hypothetical protein KEM54_004075 [Ascosphaera aggregata]